MRIGTFLSYCGGFAETVAQLADSEKAGLDLVFLAMPHGASQSFVPKLIGEVGHIVDLGADFRLGAADYEQWYGEAHQAPELVAQFAYGMDEF